jgi:hypothetical protein
VDFVLHDVDLRVQVQVVSGGVRSALLDAEHDEIGLRVVATEIGLKPQAADEASRVYFYEIFSSLEHAATQ